MSRKRSTTWRVRSTPSQSSTAGATACGSICSNTVELWDRREELFPHLCFGLDVEDHLAELNPGLLSTLVNRLADLYDSAAAWPDAGGAAPPWLCKVTPESEST